MTKSKVMLDPLFARIVGSDTKLAMYDAFGHLEDLVGLPENDEIKRVREIYNITVKNIEPTLKELAKLEELLIQLRCRQFEDRDIKLSEVREYLYARTHFYRPNTTTNDIRVIIGLKANYPGTMNSLLKNKKFLKIARVKLENAMDEHIRENVKAVEAMSENFVTL